MENLSCRILMILISNTLVEVPMKHILSIRKMVHQNEFKDEYINSFKKLFNRIQRNNLTVASPPMVLFHDEEFSSFGLDTEFATGTKISMQVYV